MTTAPTLLRTFAVHVALCVPRGAPHMFLPGFRLGLYIVLDVVTASHTKKKEKEKKSTGKQRCRIAMIRCFHGMKVQLSTLYLTCKLASGQYAD